MMKPTDRKKMCSECEGTIPFDTDHCPYCSSEQTPSENEAAAQQALRSKHQSLQDSLTSLYTPPYSSKTVSSAEEQKRAQPKVVQPQPKREGFKTATYEKRAESMHSQISPQHSAQEEQETSQRGTFWPVFFLSIAANILAIGLLQFFFSDNGVLTLEWSSKYWFLYCLASVPLFFLGFKKANKLKDLS